MALTQPPALRESSSPLWSYCGRSRPFLSFHPNHLWKRLHLQPLLLVDLLVISISIVVVDFDRCSPFTVGVWSVLWFSWPGAAARRLASLQVLRVSELQMTTLPMILLAEGQRYHDEQSGHELQNAAKRGRHWKIWAILSCRGPGLLWLARRCR